MRRYNAQEIEALTNHDRLLCKPPHRNDAERRQYYARFINRLLWRYFTAQDWQQVARLLPDLKIEPKLKKTTEFLIARHIPYTPNAAD